MGIVLLEPPHPGQADPGSLLLVPVQFTNVCQPEGQLHAIIAGSGLLVEHDAVAEAVPNVDVGAEHSARLLLREGEDFIVNVSSLGWKKQDPGDNSWKKKTSC